MGIYRVFEVIMPAVLSNLGIMSRSNIVALILLRRLHELAPLDMRVAKHTWVRRSTTLILRDKVLNNLLPKSVLKI